ncbi:FecR domain-containing protein [Halobacteriovorax sp. HLS]|uniref:FecR family protein n=1 Tax=Halobacteriovorax sp. HLS TaxID=2234000 RepID=UPI0013E3C73E|nr:FecR family protein [Halobacteriovorax sp. HLS]
MSFAIKSLLLLVFASHIFAATGPIGSVTKLKGEISLTRNQEIKTVNKQSEIFEKDIIETSKSSFIKILFKDKTTLLIGPTSKIIVEKFPASTAGIINLMKGSFRVKVNKKVPNEDSILFKTNQVSLAIRGTEFLTNTYLVKAKSVTDTALLEGVIDTTVTNIKPFTLEAGQVFNTSQLAAGGALGELSQEQLELLLKNEDLFLPKIQNLDGSFNDINDSIKSISSQLSPPTSILPATALAGAALGVLLTSDNEQKKKTETPIPTKVSKKDEELDLKKLPWSIRDAILKDKEYKKENICFYWFFKRIPGGGEEELFRRERDCEEYEYEL